MERIFAGNIRPTLLSSVNSGTNNQLITDKLKNCQAPVSHHYVLQYHYAKLQEQNPSSSLNVYGIHDYHTQLDHYVAQRSKIMLPKLSCIEWSISSPIYADKPVASLGIRKRNTNGMKEQKN